MTGLSGRAAIACELARGPVSAAVAFTAAAAFILAAGGASAPVVPLTLGVLALAGGASALNQFQERATDARMERTRMRPLPSGRVGVGFAVGLAGALLAGGLLLLAARLGPLPCALGAAAAAWYNGVYTPLKRRTPWAAIPGSLVGGLVPAIGWSAAGASLADPRLAPVCLFFWMWQIPHFWLLAARYGDEFEGAGLPSATTLFTRDQLARLAAAWLFATALSGLLLPLYAATRSRLVLYALGALAAGLTAESGRLLGRGGRGVATAALFRRVNGYVAAVALLLCLDPYLR